RHWAAAGGSPFAAGPWRTIHDRYEAAARQALGDDEYTRRFQRGGDLTLDEAVAYALSSGREPAKQTQRATGASRLTRRETEVAELVADGLNTKQIADRLVISQRTVESHVANILTKLSFTDRKSVV